MQNWYKNIQGNFNLPIRESRDCDYYPSLKSIFNEYVDSLEKKIGVPNSTVVEIKSICKTILKAVDLYYEANVFSAQSKILKLLKNYVNNPFVFSDLKNSYAFRGIAPFLTGKELGDKEYKESSFARELNFFKGRVANDPTTRYMPEEMLHIPFNQRGKVKTQRFSIAGIPCMYFGSSSYVCWLELGKPQNEFFNVSSYIIKDDLRILNLVCAWNLICGLSSGVVEDNTYNINLDDLIIDLLKMWPLVCATSYKIDENDRSFRSEYIISQLIMLCLNELKVDAVAYISKQVSSDTTGYPNCINLAVPAKNDNHKISSYCKNLNVSSVVNFGEYNKLNASDRHARKLSYINECFDSHNHIALASKYIRYDSSVFGGFDNYLVSLDHYKLDIDKLNNA